jgi:uncharacterized membrane protein YgdD (TMEM256/DUF423 family)
MKHTHRVYTKLGFFFAGLSVVLGAFGSHFLRDFISELDVATFETGVRYQFMHALAIIVISLAHRKFDESKLDIILGLFIIGIIIFSGSLYLLATRELWGNDSFKVIGAVTPLGGLAFISAWTLLLFKGFPKEEAHSHKDDSSSNSSRRHRKHRNKTSEQEGV